MSLIVDDATSRSSLDPTVRIGARIRIERENRGLSLSEMAVRSGVSRAMINKVERGESSPTAALLGRLSGALELSISALVARAEGQPGRIRRVGERPRWTDPATGNVRQQVSPDVIGPRLDLTEVALPPGAEVTYPAAALAFGTRLVWVLEGALTCDEGSVAHVLLAGDCLRFGEPVDSTYRNTSDSVVRYAVLVS